MKKVLAVFDIGKTNKKLLLFDDSFKVVKAWEEKFPVITDEDGDECDDIDLITNWMKSEVQNLVEGDEYELAGVNFSTYGASLMFLNEKGERLTPVYNYLKEVPLSITDNLFESYGGRDEFCRKTASPALGLLLNSGIQILWMQQNKKETYDKAKSILHFPQYLSYILTGKVVSEPTSIGCHTFMWDFDNMCYHKWIADNKISLPEPITNDVVFEAKNIQSICKVGTGIHDSSASLAPYILGSKEKFILVSTGTWCITMNPYNTEPLTPEQLEQDCLCFLSPEKQQVKSSRLFMGHFHEVWAEKLSEFFKAEFDAFKTVSNDDVLIEKLNTKYADKNVFFPGGKEAFETDKENVDLSQFADYKEAYTKLMIDMTTLSVQAIELVIPKNDETKNLYISGGFARNPIYIDQIKKHFPEKEIFTSEIDNASALGAAIVIADVLGKQALTNLDLGLQKC